MTFARYEHLKYGHPWPEWKALPVSWAIASVECCFAVPANRLGSAGGFPGFQLKITREVVTLTGFMVFVVTFLKKRLVWNNVVARASWR